MVVDYIELGKRIKKIRKSKGITQEQLANMAGNSITPTGKFAITHAITIIGDRLGIHFFSNKILNIRKLFV